MTNNITTTEEAQRIVRDRLHHRTLPTMIEYRSDLTVGTATKEDHENMQSALEYCLPEELLPNLDTERESLVDTIIDVLAEFILKTSCCWSCINFKFVHKDNLGRVAGTCCSEHSEHCNKVTLSWQNCPEWEYTGNGLACVPTIPGIEERLLPEQMRVK